MTHPIKLKTLVEWNSEYKSIMESPMKVPGWFNPQLEERPANFAYTQIVMKDGKHLGKFGKYDIYGFNHGGDTVNIFVGGGFTYAFFKFLDKNNNFNEKQVWQDSALIGLCREIYLDYYLKKYDRIISDGTHTELGGKYWKKLLKEAQKHGHKIYVIDGEENKTDIDNVDEIDKFYGYTSKSQKYKFVIEK